MDRLTEQEIATRLEQLPGWTRQGDTLSREFTFGDFTRAFGWMASVALCAERMNHHPDWKNVYSKVSVSLSTHDAGGITEKDFELAQSMNELFRG